MRMSVLLRNATHRYLQSIRNFTRNAVRLEKSPATQSAADAEVPGTSKLLSGKTHRVNSLEKRLLVWTGKYKSIGEVPSFVAPETVERARNKTRIRLANVMMLLTAIACVGMVISGKKAAGRGETVQQANLEWHKKVKEEDEKLAASAAK